MDENEYVPFNWRRVSEYATLYKGQPHTPGMGIVKTGWEKVSEEEWALNYYSTEAACRNGHNDYGFNYLRLIAYKDSQDDPTCIGWAALEGDDIMFEWITPMAPEEVAKAIDPEILATLCCVPEHGYILFKTYFKCVIGGMDIDEWDKQNNV
jgi:hypothetical protein